MADDDDLELMHALAFFYWRRKQTERAAALAYAAFRLGKQDTKTTLLLAVTLLDLGLPDRSLGILEKLQDADDPLAARSAMPVRARALLRLGHVRQALSLIHI